MEAGPTAGSAEAVVDRAAGVVWTCQAAAWLALARVAPAWVAPALVAPAAMEWVEREQTPGGKPSYRSSGTRGRNSLGERQTAAGRH